MEEKSARGCGRSGEIAIVGIEDGGNIVDPHVAAGGVKHGADEVAHHVVEEPVAADAVDE